MDIWTIFLTGVGLAMDAFSVSVTDGIVLKKPTLLQSAKIALFFGVFQFIMPCIGYFLASSFSEYITAFDHWIAFVLLAFIGGKMLFEALTEKDGTEEIKNPLFASTLTILAIATSIDALAVGVTFATVPMPISILAASALIGITTFAICLTGVFIGSKFGNLLGNKAEIVGGVVLIFIGIKVLLEHLLA